MRTSPVETSRKGRSDAVAFASRDPRQPQLPIGVATVGRHAASSAQKRKYTLAQAAKYLSLSEDTLRRAIKRGELRSHKSVHRNQVVYAISEDDLCFYMKLRAMRRPERQEAMEYFRKNGAWPEGFQRKVDRLPKPLPFDVRSGSESKVVANEEDLAEKDNVDATDSGISAASMELAQNPRAIQYLLDDAQFLREVVQFLREEVNFLRGVVEIQRESGR